MDKNVFKPEWYAAMDPSENALMMDSLFDLKTTKEGVPIRKLFITNMANRTSSKELCKLFSKYGQIEDCYIIKQSGKSKFAFITFNNIEGAFHATCADHFPGFQLRGQCLQVSPAYSSQQPDYKTYMKLTSSLSAKECESVSQLGPDIEDSTMNQLLDDCLIEIFLWLPIIDRIRIERVCKRWRALSQQSWREIRRLDLAKSTWGYSSKNSTQKVTDQILRKVLIRVGKYLKHLDLFSMNESLGDRRSCTLEIVAKFCPTIQCLNVKGFEITSPGLHLLAKNCHNIHKLIIGELYDESECYLSELFQANKQLKHLEIVFGFNITGHCFKNLPIDAIEELHLNGCIGLKRNYVHFVLKNCKNLRSLTLKENYREKLVSDESLRLIGNMKTMKYLRLDSWNENLSAHGLKNLAELNNLEILHLNRNTAVTNGLLINILNNCEKLQMLDIDGCIEITDEGLEGIGTLKHLEELDISNLCRVTDRVLDNFHHLKVLKCGNCKNISPLGIIRLIRIATNLTTLDLSGSTVAHHIIESIIEIIEQRNNNTILEIIVAGDEVKNLSKFMGSSQFLKISSLYMFPQEDDIL